MKYNKPILGIFMTMLILISACGSGPVSVDPENDQGDFYPSTGNGLYFGPDLDESVCPYIMESIGGTTGKDYVEFDPSIFKSINDLYGEEIFNKVISYYFGEESIDEIQKVWTAPAGTTTVLLSNKIIKNLFDGNFADDKVGQRIIDVLMNNLALYEDNFYSKYDKLLEDGFSIGLNLCGDSRVNACHTIISNGVGKEIVVRESRIIGGAPALFDEFTTNSLLLTHANLCSDVKGCGALAAFEGILKEGISKSPVAYLLDDYTVNDILTSPDLKPLMNEHIDNIINVGVEAFVAEGVPRPTVEWLVERDDIGFKRLFVTDANDQRKIAGQFQAYMNAEKFGNSHTVTTGLHNHGNQIITGVDEIAIKAEIIADKPIFTDVDVPEVVSDYLKAHNGPLTGLINEDAMKGQTPFENLFTTSRYPKSALLDDSAQITGHTFTITVPEMSAEPSMSAIDDAMRVAIDNAMAQLLYSTSHKWAKVHWIVGRTPAETEALSKAFLSPENIEYLRTDPLDTVYVVEAVVKEGVEGAGKYRSIKVKRFAKSALNAIDTLDGASNSIGGVSGIFTLMSGKIDEIVDTARVAKLNANIQISLFLKAAEAKPWVRVAGTLVNSAFVAFDIYDVWKAGLTIRDWSDETIVYDSTKVLNGQTISLDLDRVRRMDMPDPWGGGTAFDAYGYPIYMEGNKYIEEMKKTPGQGMDPYMYNGDFYQIVSNEQLYESYANMLVGLVYSRSSILYKKNREEAKPIIDGVLQNDDILTKGMVLSYIDGSIIGPNDYGPFERRKFATPINFVPLNFYDNDMNTKIKGILTNEDRPIIELDFKNNVKNELSYNGRPSPMVLINYENGDVLVPCTDSETLIPVVPMNPVVDYGENVPIYYIYAFTKKGDDRIHFSSEPGLAEYHLGTNPSIDVDSLIAEGNLRHITREESKVLSDVTPIETPEINDDDYLSCYDILNVDDSNYMDYEELALKTGIPLEEFRVIANSFGNEDFKNKVTKLYNEKDGEYGIPPKVAIAGLDMSYNEFLDNIWLKDNVVLVPSVYRTNDGGFAAYRCPNADQYPQLPIEITPDPAGAVEAISNPSATDQTSNPADGNAAETPENNQPPKAVPNPAPYEPYCSIDGGYGCNDGEFCKDSSFAGGTNKNCNSYCSGTQTGTLDVVYGTRLKCNPTITDVSGWNCLKIEDKTTYFNRDFTQGQYFNFDNGFDNPIDSSHVPGSYHCIPPN
jgi:hypothetical protein